MTLISLRYGNDIMIVHYNVQATASKFSAWNCLEKWALTNCLLATDKNERSFFLTKFSPHPTRQKVIKVVKFKNINLYFLISGTLTFKHLKNYV